jgi:hypothetical protein
MDDDQVLAELKELPFEKKLEMLSEADKAYVRGYVERAALEQERRNREEAAREEKDA